MSNRNCPQCHSDRLFKDGFRRLDSGARVQRFLCRDCGFRFSEKPPSQTIPQRELNRDTDIHYDRYICAIKEAKNMSYTAEKIPSAGVLSPQAEARGQIVGFSFWLLKQGYSKATIVGRVKLLNRLLRLGANFTDEESIKEIIAKQQWTVSRKLNAVDAFTSFLQMQGKTWTPPIYKRTRKLPFIPTEAELDQLIAGCSRRLSTFLQLLKETGMRCGEACGFATKLISNDF